ncbi:uncharacterized protein LOC108630195 isoform X2 [Ceratina calcarata]|uniref:Uncharacterized protein LOC108630195 isoform X2 n=1 Tax=Ceratina calcarata TaxID=156304 RepID=A0AAJ7S8Y7_9HYME|nr:uncharacterized protein LOC108630195 isoform X2 [Ceratina calcarata]
MSINVTVNGNRFNIRRGRMVLSDLDQIKKNERDRRRRLRLEQVRQQSKEISDRLLERTKNIAKEEFKKLEDNSKLKEIYNGKIMEVQQKYQEDMADIGQAHLSAALEPDHDALIEEKERRNKSAATKRGQEAVKQVKESQQRETVQQHQHQERLRQVRELENLRATMIAQLSKKSVPEPSTICISVQNEIDDEDRQQDGHKRTKKLGTKKSPIKISKAKPKTKTFEVNREQDNLILEEESFPQLTEESVPKSVEQSVPKSAEQSVPKSVEQSVPKSAEQSLRTEPERVDEIPRKERMETANVPSKVDKSARYNPEDYVQTSSDTTYSDSSSSFSDDSSYFSDSGEQFREINQPRYVKCPGSDKVQVYDHNRHQKKVYDQPVGVVEKIQTWNEPSATDLAQEIERAQTAESHLSESRKQNAQKRGEDAVLREKVRRDYQTLMQNLDQLASEERKLKASQAVNYPEERRRLLRDQHKQKLNRAMKTLLDGECLAPCAPRPTERQITLAPIERDKKRKDIQATWEDPSSPNQRTVRRDAQSKYKGNESSREVQILDMLKKVERQKRLLLQEFGADLPDDIFNASIRPLFEKDKSVQTQPTDAPDAQVCRSPEIKVIDVSLEEKSKKDKKNKNKERADPSTERKEIAVQTMTEDEVVQDKGTQVELIQEKESSIKEDRRVRHHPLEPEVIIIRPDVNSSNSTSSDTLREVSDLEKESPKVTPKRKKYSVKTARQTPSKTSYKSVRKIVPKSPAKKVSKSKTLSPKKTPSKADVPSKRIKMYVDKNGVNIKVKPPEVAEILVDVSTQCAQEIAVGTEKLGRVAETKQQWTHSKSFKMKDISDTSTSFASPPPIRPRDILEALSNNISILEMLDSSANESLKRLRRDVSPVSTPETPSPRTMRMPSNIPHPEKFKRLFHYSSTESQTNDYRQTTTSPPKSDTSTSSSNDGPEHIPNAYSRGPVSLEFCLCHNPECRRVHARFEEIRNYALKNCPHMLRKYDDLQNTCAERIISLTNLIEKVRNEQKGMEFSMIDPSDDTSLMQLPPPQIATNDLETVHRLVENIEAIHNQLAKTLIESQKIVKTKTAVDESEEIKETEKGTSTERKAEDKVKPKIVSVEKVDIAMDRFKRLAPSAMTSTPERDDKPSEEEVIERLSKEILEQSKGLNSNLVTSKDICTSTINLSVQTPTDNIIRIENSKVQKERGSVRDSDKEAKGTKDFVPLLHDIPKVVSRMVDNSAHVNGRSKPPVSLLSGPYRTEIDSSGHELSTIIEFDTPDTVNRSQGNIRSPLSARKVTETQMKKSTAIVKPSGHITPSRSDKLRDPTIAKLSQEIKEPSIFFDSPITSKNVESQDLNKELKDEILQCDTVDRGSTQAEECKDKDKITSSSSNSFSELSGVSQIASTPSSTLLRYASSPEEMETALKKLGLGWAITTLKKTREASALSSSSNSDTPINTAKRILSPVKKQNNYGLLDFSDVSSISIKEASKSTEQAVLMKGRTSTPKLQQNSNSESNSSNTNNSENFQVPEEGLIIPNVSLTKTKSNVKNLENL